MKIKDEIARLKNLAEKTIPIKKKLFGQQCKEYCFLYKSIYNTFKNPNMKIIAVYGTTNVYVDRLEYIDMLHDLALLRYKFSRKKFKGYVKNEKRA